MSLDIELFREEKGGNPDIIRKSQKARFKDVGIVDEIIAQDKLWREEKFQLDQKKREQNKTQKEYTPKRKLGEKDESIEAKLKELEKQIEELENKAKQTKHELEKKIHKIGNIVHDSVPISNDEKENGLYAKKGEETLPVVKNGLKHHHELLYMIDGYEPERGAKIVGHRGYFLKGPGVWLNQALINYGLKFLHEKGYSHLQTPFFMKKEVMDKVAQLEEYDEALYKISGDTSNTTNNNNTTNNEGEEKYLIATSEQPICAYHWEETLDPKDLPLRYAGYSTCFRKEAGAYGKDAWGIFRIHQFEKIEQFCITSPEKSWEMHEEMLNIAKDFYESLGFTYRVVNIVSGELNNAAAKKYDLEAWFPTLKVYRELVSCSNCTDYQSRKLDIKYGTKKKRFKTTICSYVKCHLVCY